MATDYTGGRNGFPNSEMNMDTETFIPAAERILKTTFDDQVTKTILLQSPLTSHLIGQTTKTLDGHHMEQLMQTTNTGFVRSEPVETGFGSKIGRNANQQTYEKLSVATKNSSASLYVEDKVINFSSGAGSFVNYMVEQISGLEKTVSNKIAQEVVDGRTGNLGIIEEGAILLGGRYKLKLNGNRIATGDTFAIYMTNTADGSGDRLKSLEVTCYGLGTRPEDGTYTEDTFANEYEYQDYLTRDVILRNNEDQSIITDADFEIGDAGGGSAGPGFDSALTKYEIVTLTQHKENIITGLEDCLNPTTTLLYNADKTLIEEFNPTNMSFGGTVLSPDNLRKYQLTKTSNRGVEFQQVKTFCTHGVISGYEDATDFADNIRHMGAQKDGGTVNPTFDGNSLGFIVDDSIPFNRMYAINTSRLNWIVGGDTSVSTGQDGIRWLPTNTYLPGSSTSMVFMRPQGSSYYVAEGVMYKEFFLPNLRDQIKVSDIKEKNVWTMA